MKRWFVGICLVMACVVVPVFVNWLRHRPHRLTEMTQHLVIAGLIVQVILVGMAVVAAWLL